MKALFVFASLHIDFLEKETSHHALCCELSQNLGSYVTDQKAHKQGSNEKHLDQPRNLNLCTHLVSTTVVVKVLSLKRRFFQLLQLQLLSITSKKLVQREMQLRKPVCLLKLVNKCNFSLNWTTNLPHKVGVARQLSVFSSVKSFCYFSRWLCIANRLLIFAMLKRRPPFGEECRAKMLSLTTV